MNPFYKLDCLCTQSFTDMGSRSFLRKSYFKLLEKKSLWQIKATLRNIYWSLFDHYYIWSLSTYGYFLSKKKDKCDWKVFCNLFECGSTQFFLPYLLFANMVTFWSILFIFLKSRCELFKWWHFQELPLHSHLLLFSNSQENLYFIAWHL